MNGQISPNLKPFSWQINCLFVGLFEDFENSVNKIFEILGLLENISLDMRPVNAKNIKVIEDIHNKPDIKNKLYPLVCHDLELYKSFLHA